MLSGKILNLCWALLQSNQRFLTSCVVRFLGIRGNTERLDCLGLLARAPRFHCRRGSVLAQERLSCLLISGAVRRLLSYSIRANRTFRRRCAFGHGLKYSQGQRKNTGTVAESWWSVRSIPNRSGHLAGRGMVLLSLLAISPRTRRPG